jgi:fatty acid desaturase
VSRDAGDVRSEPSSHVVIRPLDVHGVAIAWVGTVAWLAALIALLPFIDDLRDREDLWWIWTCAWGVALGLVGVVYTRRRQARSNR